MALRADSYCDWSANNRMEELPQEDTEEMMRFRQEQAADVQKKELSVFKKKTKTQIQLPQAEPVPLIIEGDLPPGQSDSSEPIEAQRRLTLPSFGPISI